MAQRPGIVMSASTLQISLVLTQTPPVYTHITYLFQNVNAIGPYLLARGLLRFNPTDHPTTFITLTTGINEGFTHMGGYLTSKIAAAKLIQLLDLEYPNLRTFSVLPGLIPTDMLIESFSALALDKGLSIKLLSTKV